MKPFFIVIFFICLVSPCFAQSAASDRFRSLSDAMGRSVESSNANLENYKQNANDGENMQAYLGYMRKYESIINALRTSEEKMNTYERTSEKPGKVSEERDKYEGFIKKLQETKGEYDNWLRNVK